MSRYYVDTNVLLGFTFLQNRWREHTERLLNSDNTVYTSCSVLYEYCTKRPNLSRGSADISWEKNDGKIDDEKMRLRRDIRQCTFELDILDEDQITPDKVSEILIQEHDVETQVDGRIRAYFDATLNQDCSRQEAKAALRKLQNRITTAANNRKDELSNLVKYVPVGSNRHPEISARLAREITYGRENDHPDARVLSDAYSLKENSIVSQVVTGDKADIYKNREEINAITGLNVQYLKDEVAGTV